MQPQPPNMAATPLHDSQPANGWGGGTRLPASLGVLHALYCRICLMCCWHVPSHCHNSAFDLAGWGGGLLEKPGIMGLSGPPPLFKLLRGEGGVGCI